MKHDIVIRKGKEFKAVSGDECENCAFVSCGINVCNSVNCQGHEREDKTDVIYKPHYRLNSSGDIKSFS